MWTPTTRRQHSREGLRYETDLTDAEWALIEPLMPKPCARRAAAGMAVAGSPQCDLLSPARRRHVAASAYAGGGGFPACGTPSTPLCAARNQGAPSFLAPSPAFTTRLQRSSLRIPNPERTQFEFVINLATARSLGLSVHLASLNVKNVLATIGKSRVLTCGLLPSPCCWLLQACACAASKPSNSVRENLTCDRPC